jgi:hypothetical protein
MSNRRVAIFFAGQMPPFRVARRAHHRWRQETPRLVANLEKRSAALTRLHREIGGAEAAHRQARETSAKAVATGRTRTEAIKWTVTVIHRRRRDRPDGHPEPPLAYGKTSMHTAGETSAMFDHSTKKHGETR